MDIPIWILVMMIFLMELVPLTMLGVGLWFINDPPEYGGMIGYRTKTSMKSAEAWAYAHKYVGRLWRVIGIAMAVSSVLIMVGVYFVFPDGFYYLCEAGGLVQCGIMLISCFAAEKKLQKLL